MRDREENRPDDRGWGLGRIIPFDPLLLVVLIAGWLLIFASASLAVQRSPEQWLPVEFVPEVLADYGVDAAESPRLAPVRPQIIEAVRQDALVAQPSAPPEIAVEAKPERLPLLLFRPTLTPTSVLSLTVTPTSTFGLAELIVSAGGPYTGEEGNPISLFAGVASASPGTISYNWDLDGDGLYNDAEGAWASTVFYDEGQYVVGVEASDMQGRVAVTTTTVSVSNVAPRIYGVEDVRADEGQKVGFEVAVSDPGHDVLLYSWDFGDGGEEMGTLNPSHTYLDNGEYEVRFRAEDNDGGVSEAVMVARVGNVAPEVDAGPDQVAAEGETIRLSGSASDAGVLDELSYVWDLDYDGVSFRPDVYGPSASVVYEEGPGEKVAALRVEDGDGGQGLDTVQVRVENVAPVIVRVWDDGPVGEGTAMNLEVEATDVGSDTLSYGFDWENDGSYEEAGETGRVSHVWPDEGEYPVGIRVTDGDGGEVYSTTLVMAYNVAPTAVVGGQPLVEYEGTAVTFDGSGSSDPGINDVLSYEWDYGDGSPVGSGPVVAHAYGDNRVYSATLTVWDESGGVSSEAVAVSIVNANPVAELGADRAVDEGGSVSLTGQASDPGWGDGLSLAWDLEYDGSRFDEDVVGTDTVERSYEDGPARHVVAFRVRDDDYPYPTDGGGGIGETIDTLEVVVNNLDPIAMAGPDQRADVGETVNFQGAATDPGTDTFTFEWDFDYDGSDFDVDDTGQTVATTYAVGPATYVVALRVTDDDGGVGIDTANVTVAANALPVAEAGGPYMGYEGESIVLSGSGVDPDGDPLSYAWDLDYDTIFETPGQVVTNTWPDDGVYTVTLRVDDGRGGVATDDATVTVENLPPIVDAGGPYTATVGITLTMVATATDVPADPLTYTWDLDEDGVFDDGIGPVLSHIWTATGLYTVTLQVNDGDGGLATDETTVNVNTLVPIAWLGVSNLLIWRRKIVRCNKKRAYDRAFFCRRQ